MQTWEYLVLYTLNQEALNDKGREGWRVMHISPDRERVIMERQRYAADYEREETSRKEIERLRQDRADRLSRISASQE